MTPEQLIEFRFHVRELVADLPGLLSAVDTCRSAEPVPQVLRRLRERDLGHLLFGLGHDAYWHAGLLVKLARGQPTEDTSAEGDAQAAIFRSEWEENPPAFDIDVDEGQARFARNLDTAGERIREALGQARSSLIELDAGQSTDQLVDRIHDLAALLAAAVPFIQEAYALAWWLYRKGDPAVAFAEDQVAKLAEPLRELEHAGAGSLSTCPNCQAQLTSDDRTWTGSYCEVCRTRWRSPQVPPDKEGEE